MSCSWVIIKKSKLTNFNDTMGDEVSTDSKTKKNKYSKKFSKISTKRLNDIDDISSEIFKVIIDDSSENDATIAQLHQMQFDNEYAQHNGKLNKFSNEPVCFDNSSSSLNYDSEEDELINLRDREDWDKYDFLEREFVSFLQCECKKRKGAKILPKHDVRRNIYKRLSFPLKFHTGDKNMFNLKSSKQVLNRLKVHLDNEQTRKNKFLDINDRTIDVIAIDQLTRLILYKMINGQLLTKVNGVIAVGKEAVILHADLDPCYPKASEPLPKECVIKVFKANPSESKQLDRHIKDGRFKDNIGNQTTRKPVNLRAEKEMVNLTRLRRVGIPCPQVVSLKQHVLVMSFIGANYDAPAPKLKDADMKYYEYISAYEEHNEQLNKFSDEFIYIENYSSSLSYDSEENELIDIRDTEEWDRYDYLEREFVSLPQYEYKKRKDAKKLPKRDVTVSTRLNTCKLLSFPPKFLASDKNILNWKSSNQVLNRLKDNEQTKQSEILDMKYRTIDVIAIDQLTRLILYKMINDRLIAKVNGVIAVGKKSVILHANLCRYYPKTSEPLSRKCVLKVFKADPCESKQHGRHVKDSRFKDNIGNQTTRKLVNLCAEKEMVNLMRLTRVGIPCPQVISLKQHVLVMSFIGSNSNVPAPKLKNADIKCYEYAYEEFFSSKGVQHIPRAPELFKSITGYNYEDKLARWRNHEMKPQPVDSTN
ncbi:hypothetical protein NQ314_004350 [Rhamnusium bicolor]|uniref:non-specific serine/threonine protein kinase n=1 Tax=Rhamnusium bicolor TaxID=1586634 RepID=A0AAV8ZLJ9_9CUCU|nr:hypothetical protein NQ314_004350 [Rhamnusium bicolor]